MYALDPNRTLKGSSKRQSVGRPDDGHGRAGQKDEKRHNNGKSNGGQQRAITEICRFDGRCFGYLSDDRPCHKKHVQQTGRVMAPKK